MNYKNPDIYKKVGDNDLTVNKMENTPQFRLENKNINPNSESKLMYTVFQYLNNILNERKQSPLDRNDENNANELLFNFLKSQLQSLYSKIYTQNTIIKNKKDPGMSSSKSKDHEVPTFYKGSKNNKVEHVFLIVNDDLGYENINNKELISVDPNSLKENSVILPLGSLPEHLKDNDLVLLVSIKN